MHIFVAFLLLLQLACGAPSQPAAFQDEVVARTAAGRASAAPGGKASAGAVFQDSVWQAGRAVDASSGGAMYQEPFTVEGDDEINALLEKAYARVLANLKEKDKQHDGILRTNNVPE